MSLTRKALAAMGIEEDKIDQIIEMHTSTTTEIKTELDKAQADAKKLPDVQKELDELKEVVAKQGGENPFEVKYEALKEEFDEYKQQVEGEKEQARKTEAYRQILKDAGISDKRIDSVLRVSEPAIEGIEFDEDGNAKEADKLIEAVKAEWSDFVVTEQVKGAQTATPPANTGGTTKTKQEIMAMTNREERRKAIAENPELFNAAE